MAWPAVFLHSVLATVCFAGNAPQIVFPRMLESRSAGGQKVVKISDEITLNLEKSTIFPDEFFVHSTADGSPIRYHMLGKEMEKTLYHDVGNMASVDVSEDDGLRIEGTLGHTLRIKPLPEAGRSVEGQSAHLLYHTDEPRSPDDEHSDYGRPPVDDSSSYLESRNLRRKNRPLPWQIFPEVHVVVDYYISRALKFNVRLITRYIAILANSANLRYQSMVDPEVQLKIVGISVTNTPEEEPYMVPVPNYEKTRNILYPDTLRNFNEYVAKQTYFSGSDIVFLLTGKNMSRWKGSTLESRTAGFAYIAGACTQWKVGMSEEPVLSFYGVHVFGHELAHSLGCYHDGQGPDDWPDGAIGSSDCPRSDGYMMSYEYVSQNMSSFSRCCQREVMNLYNRPNYKCLSEQNAMKTGFVSSSCLPGEASSNNAYCKKGYREDDYVGDDRYCALGECPTEGEIKI